jgi:hypothetical protein
MLATKQFVFYFLEKHGNHKSVLTGMVAHDLISSSIQISETKRGLFALRLKKASLSKSQCIL